MTTDRRMNDLAQATLEAARAVPPQAWGTPPATVVGLSLAGYSIADATQAVMFVWGVCSVIPLIWRGVKWFRRKGWNDR